MGSRKQCPAADTKVMALCGDSASPPKTSRRGRLCFEPLSEDQVSPVSLSEARDICFRSRQSVEASRACWRSHCSPEGVASPAISEHVCHPESDTHGKLSSVTYLVRRDTLEHRW